MQDPTKFAVGRHGVHYYPPPLLQGAVYANGRPNATRPGPATFSIPTRKGFQQVCARADRSDEDVRARDCGLWLIG